MAAKIQHCVRTLRLKVKAEGYAWLNTAAIEVNQVWNFANATSYKAARPFAGRAKWLSAFDLDKLTAGATECFERIGSGTIQRVNAEFASLPPAASNSREQSSDGESAKAPSAPWAGCHSKRRS
jgi:putative transposase